MENHRRSRLISFFIFSLLITSAALILQAQSASDSQKAVVILERDVQANPSNSELWLHLGFAYRKLGQINQSQIAFEKAASLNPNNHDAFYMLGLIYEKKAMKQDALRVWKQYLTIETDPGKKAEAEKHIHYLSQ